MAALVARAALGNGLVVEVYEEGDMWLIESSGKRQEIKLEGSAPANLLTFLTKNQDLLRPASANSDKDAQLAELEAIYGPLYPRSQHKPGEMIRYQIEGLRYRGEVLWVQAPVSRAGVTYLCAISCSARRRKTAGSSASLWVSSSRLTWCESRRKEEYPDVRMGGSERAPAPVYAGDLRN